MTKAELKGYLSERLFSGRQYLKADLIRLCKEVKNLCVQPDPTADERKAAFEQRLQEIFTVADDCLLPSPSDPKINWTTSMENLPDVSLIFLVLKYFLVVCFKIQSV
jgi:hypothetical protein